MSFMDMTEYKIANHTYDDTIDFDVEWFLFKIGVVAGRG